MRVIDPAAQQVLGCENTGSCATKTAQPCSLSPRLETSAYRRKSCFHLLLNGRPSTVRPLDRLTGSVSLSRVDELASAGGDTMSGPRPVKASAALLATPCRCGAGTG
jgi:hypothetical protein